MNKIYIYVSYHNKNLVKSLSCKWDFEKKMWYMPININILNVFELLKLQKNDKIYFIKEFVYNRKDRDDYIQPDYRKLLCLVPYTENEILLLHLEHSKNETETINYFDETEHIIFK